MTITILPSAHIKEKTMQLRKKRLSSLSWAAWFVWLGVGVIDYIDGALIYIFYFIRDTMAALSPAMRAGLAFGLFPITAFAAVVYAVCAWISAIIEREPDPKTHELTFKTEDKIRLGYNTTMAILAVTATVIGLVLGAGAGIYTLIIYGCSLTLSSVYQLSSMAYHAYQVSKLKKEIAAVEESAFVSKTKSSDGKTIAYLHADQMVKLKQLEDEQASRKTKALSHFVIGSTSILIAIAGLCVGTFGWPFAAALGVAASLVGAVFFGVGFYKSVKAKKAADALAAKGASKEEIKFSTARYLFKVFGNEENLIEEKRTSMVIAPKAGAFGRVFDTKGINSRATLVRVSSSEHIRNLEDVEKDMRFSR